ncbi:MULTISPECIES: hypothetical protein [unclassified Lysinibacillus]|uniref:hypothetical protein n=1 Tax=unclassified Lysinibacillus TaxID=2636778 RepID=UPI00382131BD
MYYNRRYINFSLKGIMMSSLVVGSFLQMDGKVAKAASNDLLNETTAEPEDNGAVYISTEESLEKGYEVFSSDKWETGAGAPRNNADPNLNALKQDKATTQQAQPQQTQKLSASQYKDFDAKAYWAKDMKWAVDQGLIVGYQNQKHPTQPAKGVGNWIDPSGNLTEYQMLNVMLRYKDGGNYENAKTSMKADTASNFAYVEYFFANQHGMMTKGSMSDASFAKQQVSRGQMAQALVSMHYGKTVTLQQAVDFMYANGITTGVNPSKGQTLDNFGASAKLSRAHIVAFMGRYNDAVKAGSIKDTLANKTEDGSGSGSIKTPQPPVVNGSSENPAPPTFEHTKYDYSDMYGKLDTTKQFTQDGIKVSYKNHTYNTKNQAEYDQVMNHINKALNGKTYSDVKLKHQDDAFELGVLEKLMNGEITVIHDRTNPASRSEENTTANAFEIGYGDAIKSGVSFDTLAKFGAATAYVGYFAGGGSNDAGPPESAYDFFIKGDIDCTSQSYASQAIYDALGYNTAVVHSPTANHDYLIIELDGQWFTNGSSLKVFNKDSVLKGDYIKYAPIKQVSQLNFINVR